MNGVETSETAVGGELEPTVHLSWAVPVAHPKLFSLCITCTFIFISHTSFPASASCGSSRCLYCMCFGLIDLLTLNS